MAEWSSWAAFWQTIATVSFNAVVTWLVNRQVLKRIEKHEEKIKFWKRRKK
jgi:hypothetical protein